MENLNDEKTANLAAEKLKKSAQKGRAWLCAGVGLMGLSFATNYLLYHSGGDFRTAMIVMTSLGAGCLLKAMADILGF